MDLLGVVRRSGVGKTDSYIAAEGNRRVCALMLLHDPEKIPTGVVGRVKMIQRLEVAARPAHISTKINVVLFKSKNPQSLGSTACICVMADPDGNGVPTNKSARWGADETEMQPHCWTRL